MAEKAEKTTLVGPDGREYTTTSKVEIVNLRARGYKTKTTATKAKTPANKSKAPENK